MDEDWIWTKRSIPLREIVENSSYPTTQEKIDSLDENLPSPLAYIISRGKESFEAYDESLPFQRNFFEIPKDMFVNRKNKEENWETQVEICANKKFKHFAFLNRKKRLYLVYDNDDFSEQRDNQPMVSVHLGEKSISSHVRNQMCKDYMMLVQRIYGEPNEATAFYRRDHKKHIRFSGDHLDAA